MKNKIVVAAMSLAVLLMIVYVPAKASSDHSTPVHITQDFTFTPCTGGETITGTLDEVFQSNFLVNHNTKHLHVHMNIHGSATGSDSGAHYQVSMEDMEMIDLQLDDTGSTEIIQNARFIGQGSAPDFHILITHHITVNADGTLVVDRMEIKSDC